MNTGQLKLLTWSAAGILGVGLAGYVGNYLLHRSTLEQGVAHQDIKDVLAKVPPIEKKAEDIVAYEKVNKALYRIDWTGKEPPKPAPPPDKTVQVPTGPEPVSTLLKVRLIKADPVDDSGSRAVIQYLAAAKVSIKDPAVVKHVGDALDGPLEYITVSDITADGVHFTFRDKNRKEEVVGVIEFVSRLDLAAIAGGKAGLPAPTEIRYPRGPNFDVAPKITVKLSDTSFQIGTDDMTDWNDNYEQYLSEVEYNRHRDPVTGKYDGISLDRVPAGSVAAAHGAKDGDVIKSINGQPVNSTNEAISFVKNNKDKYTEWVVEVENKGKTRFITYKVPKKK